MRILLALIVLFIGGCDNGIDTTKNQNPSDRIDDYSSSDFQNADPKVQEDIMIYNHLRKMGYSDEEAKEAVINSMKK